MLSGKDSTRIDGVVDVFKWFKHLVPVITQVVTNDTSVRCENINAKLDEIFNVHTLSSAVAGSDVVGIKGHPKVLSIS